MYRTHVPGHRRDAKPSPSGAVVLPGPARCPHADTRRIPVAHAVGKDRREPGSLRIGEGDVVRVGIDRNERALQDVAALRFARREPRVAVDRIGGRARARRRRTAPIRRSTPVRPAACSGSSRTPVARRRSATRRAARSVSFAPAALPSSWAVRSPVGAVHRRRFGSSVPSVWSRSRIEKAWKRVWMSPMSSVYRLRRMIGTSSSGPGPITVPTRYAPSAVSSRHRRRARRRCCRRCRSRRCAR